MSEIERTARLLAGEHADMPIDGIPAWQWEEFRARRLHEAGLVLLPIEPDEATVDDIAKAMHDDYPHPMRQEPWDEATDVGKTYWRGKARAAYRAAVKGGA